VAPLRWIASLRRCLAITPIFSRPPSMLAHLRYNAALIKGTGPSGRLGKAAMSDDSFIREVNEEMRKDQAKALWDRYGPLALAAAILIVLVTAATVGYNYWVERQANRSG